MRQGTKTCGNQSIAAEARISKSWTMRMEKLCRPLGQERKAAAKRNTKGQTATTKMAAKRKIGRLVQLLSIPTHQTLVK